MRDTPVRLSADEIAFLVSKLPDKDARDKLITGHLRLAKHLVKRVHSFSNRDDLLGAAMLTLVRCVKRLASGEKVISDGNISRWLAKRMLGAIRHETCNNNVVTIHASTIFRHGESVSLKRHEKSIDSIGSNNQFDEYDRLEEVRSILNSSLEHKVFDLRYQGLNDLEIGDLLGISRRAVFGIRHEIGKRFLEMRSE